MHLHYKNGNDLTNSVSLVTSILVRYPEVSTIKYNPDEKVIKFNFLLNQHIGSNELSALKKLLQDSIELYNLLEDRSPTNITVSIKEIEQFTMVEIVRDMGTLVQGEIALIVHCLQQAVKTVVAFEHSERYGDEDLQFQEELIENMLYSVKVSQDDKHLFAFREEGRVLVYNL